jgi:hypothetical protein
MAKADDKDYGRQPKGSKVRPHSSITAFHGHSLRSFEADHKNTWFPGSFDQEAALVVGLFLSQSNRGMSAYGTFESCQRLENCQLVGKDQK